jgi:hypothetical protein
VLEKIQTPLAVVAKVCEMKTLKIMCNGTEYYTAAKIHYVYLFCIQIPYAPKYVARGGEVHLIYIKKIFVLNFHGIL